MPLIKLFSREYSVQYTEASLESLGFPAKPYLPSLVLSQAYLPEDKNQSCYADAKEWQTFLSKLEARYRTKQNLELFFKQFHVFGKKYLEISKKIGSENLKQASNKQLAENYRAYQKILIGYSAYLWMGYLLSQGGHVVAAKKILENKGIVDEKISSALFRPSKLSSILSLQDHLARLKAQGRGLSPTQTKIILKKYLWMPCLDIHNSPWTIGDIKNFFAGLKPAAKQVTFLKAVKLAQLSKKELVLFKLVKELIYTKDMRDEYRRRGIYNILPLFTQLSRRLGLSRSQLAYFTSAEIIEGLNRSIKLNMAGALSRQKGFLIYQKNRKIIVTSNPKEIAKFRSKNIQAASVLATELKGIIASAGYAKGKVQRVFGVKDLAKVKTGNIMVAITTHPDFVPAMHRAGAIITDEGGLTSHAAIVAREFGTPCIVGTNSATKFLKDGDCVEVDANKGRVKIIKK